MLPKRYDPVAVWKDREYDGYDARNLREQDVALEGCRIGHHDFRCPCGCGEPAETHLMDWNGACRHCFISVKDAGLAPRFEAEVPYRQRSTRWSAYSEFEKGLTWEAERY